VHGGYSLIGGVKVSENIKNNRDISEECMEKVEKEFLDAGWEKVVIGTTVLLQSPTHSRKEALKEGGRPNK
jgi:hypothetical protein